MMESFEPVFTVNYDPLRAGSIDGTDQFPHDKAISRAMGAVYKPNKYIKGDPDCTVFVGHLNPNTNEETIDKCFSEFGKILNVRVVRDIVTGCSKCYAFVEFSEPYEARSAIRNGHKMVVDDHEVLVDAEKERNLKGWIPRRLGGGLGGKRESGQLRFGGIDRPFRRPLVQGVKKDTGRTSQSQHSSKRDYGHRHSRSEKSYRDY